MSREREIEFAEELLEEETGRIRNKHPFDRTLIAAVSIGWALFQLALPTFVLLDSITTRAIHLAFAITLVFLSHPMSKHRSRHRWLHNTERIPLIDFVFAGVACFAVLYIVLDWSGIVSRAGLPTERDLVMSLICIFMVLEASRRVIGLPLALIAVAFTVYSILGPYMPSVFAFAGVTVNKYISKVVLSTEGIYGIPLDVSANTVFLFVLLGSMLDKFGAGLFFNDMAISLLGRYTGGPAKASVVSSGLTGLVSGSSIANVVTTGTFTIPLMKKVGYPGKIAAATEVAASTNGQLMPPIMGAAAFIIAEYLSLPYLDVVKAAAIPAFVSYIALFYITHLEAKKRGMTGLPPEEIPKFSEVFKGGFYHLIPLSVLVYELMVMRHSPKLASFNAIVTLLVVMLIRAIYLGVKNQTGIGSSVKSMIGITCDGLKAGSRNMLAVALATATAGIVVGIVTMGIGGMIVGMVEVLSMGNILLLLFITAIASLVLGMGLPTTATYIVMASITVPVITKLSGDFGVAIPAIAAHLFCFYFGILADDTPPVGLAAYTAAAIAKSDPIPTGIQGFIYDLRTAVIPFMFVFNAEIVMVGIKGFWHAMLVFFLATMGALAFTNAVQGWYKMKNSKFEMLLFLCASFIFFYPAFFVKYIPFADFSHRYYIALVGFIIYGAIWIMQKRRKQGVAA